MKPAGHDRDTRGHGSRVKRRHDVDDYRRLRKRSRRLSRATIDIALTDIITCGGSCGRGLLSRLDRKIGCRECRKAVDYAPARS